ncbi:peptidylprolyl isomerase [Methylomicrobium sp. Wu6]|uniref:peptidylprolyl isomerase n=1 Tax=Methylomicrobium sp. Wu6 TaxID=3107928 RepID=UPI002DD6198E|nr:peptidylprolyl isomerase [Methylomicrobium sp. Wu6]MEC4749364.1 peptidylprolyl isomerase [Methylomicrobium sp. Wu6]
MNKTIIPLLVAGAGLIAGCEPQSGDTGAASSAAPIENIVKKEDAVASVNGKYISKAQLENLEKEIAARAHGASFPKEKLVEELIQRELLVQDALQKQLDKSPEYLAQLEDAKKSILTQTELKNFFKTNPVTDAEVKAEYDSKVVAETGTEYKARHILVKTEDEAKKIIAELDKGGDFAKLANKYSIDAKESQNGGDLGWFVSDQMVKPFSDAVAKLEKGKYTSAPVQTQFGWHVILREDSRAQTPPPLEAVKEQLTPYLQRQKFQKMIETMRQQAKVEILVPLTEEKPKTEAPAAPPAATAEPAAEQKPATEGAAAKEAAPATAEKAPAEAAPAHAEPAPAEAAKPAAEPAKEETKPAESAPAPEKK